MLHIRRGLTRAEKEQYQRWLAERKPRITQAQAGLLARDYWAKSAASYAFKTAGRSTAVYPSGQLPAPELPKKNELHEMEPEQREEYLKREAAAQVETLEKQNFVGPAYNKGGDVYYSPGMRESMKQGSHRRR